MRSLLLLLVSLFFVVVVADTADEHENCRFWAESGECESNAGYMLTHCAHSCDLVASEKEDIDAKMAGIDSFYDLQALDIDGEVLEFSKFKGQVVVLTNVASFCGYTDSHYHGLVELWSTVADSKQVNILAFPCNQFGKQEPGEPDAIKAFAEKRGVKFTMMNKIDVNGPNADLVYQYLKYKAGPDHIQWNFATYYLVGPDGSIEAHSGVEPMDLKDAIYELAGLQDEL